MYKSHKLLWIFLGIIIFLIGVFSVYSFYVRLSVSTTQSENSQVTEKPDLIIKAINISIDRHIEEIATDLLRPNEVFINREVIVKNIGSITVEKLSVTFIDPITGRKLKSGQVSHRLNPGEEFNMGPNYDFFDCSIGWKRIKATVDYENEISEENEANNVFEIKFESNCAK